MPGYELKMNSYDLGVDIELYDAVQRLRFEHPEVKAVVLTGGLDKMFCAGANIRMLAAVAARVEGELLQVHQRDPQRHRGRDRALRPDLDRRGQRHRGRRRLRAGAGLRRDRADRRRLLDRVPARGAAARRAARHRRPDPVVDKRHVRRDLRRLLRHQVRGLPRQARPSSGGWSTRPCREPSWDETVAARAAGAGRGAPTVRPGDRRSR